MTFEEVRKIINDVEGWLLDGEANALYDTAKKCKGLGEIVEVGSWKGKSTICLAKGSIGGSKIKITAIDPHVGSSEQQEIFGKNINTFEEFKKNIREANVDAFIFPKVKTSEEVAKTFDKPVEFIFIDGAHDYDSVKKDFDLWFPKVINGGIMAFHDSTCFDGPKKVVKQFIYKSLHFRKVYFVDSTTFAEKVEKNSFKDRVQNRYVLFLKLIYETTSKLHPPKFVKVIGKKVVSIIH